MSPCVTCNVWERKNEAGQKGGYEHSRGAGSIKGENKNGRDIGFVVTVSSPMAEKMCAHMLQQSGWKSRACCIHSSRASALMVVWLAKSLLSPHPDILSLSFFFLFSTFTFPTPWAICLLFASTSSGIHSHHVTRKQASQDFFIFLSGGHRLHSQTTQVVQNEMFLILTIKFCSVKLKLEPLNWWWKGTSSLRKLNWTVMMAWDR